MRSIKARALDLHTLDNSMRCLRDEYKAKCYLFVLQIETARGQGVQGVLRGCEDPEAEDFANLMKEPAQQPPNEGT